MPKQWLCKAGRQEAKQEYNEWTEILQKTGMGAKKKKKKKIIKVSGKKFYALSNQG